MKIANMKDYIRKINNFLNDYFGFHLVKKRPIPKGFKEKYHKNLAKVLKNSTPFTYVEKAFRWDSGHHKEYYVDFECSFAADCITNINPGSILDIGSYRHFLIGLLAHYKVTTIDIRERSTDLKNETIITCDAKNIPLQDNSFDMVLTLCSIEHFGLGRYGDEFDLDGDIKAILEFMRVLKSNGHFVFSIPITKGQSFIAFNAHRVYSYEMIRSFCKDLELVNEEFFSFDFNNFCSLDQVTCAKNKFDIYLGCFKK